MLEACLSLCFTSCWGGVMPMWTDPQALKENDTEDKGTVPSGKWNILLAINYG